jgi:hypothetical protein
MSDPKKSRAIYPIRLEGVQVAQRHQDCINTEIKRRGASLPEGKRRRLRNPIIRDLIDFACEHYDLFLTWIATRSNPA